VAPGVRLELLGDLEVLLVATELLDEGLMVIVDPLGKQVERAAAILQTGLGSV